MPNVEEIVIPFAPGLDLVQVFIRDADGEWRNWLIYRHAANAEKRAT